MKLTERQFQTQVMGLASFYGWRIYHTYDSRRSQRGFPDLVLVRDTELIFAELKTEKGRVRPEQQDWVAALQVIADASGGTVDVYLWRPDDFDDINGRLSRGRHKTQPLYRDAA